MASSTTHVRPFPHRRHSISHRDCDFSAQGTYLTSNSASDIRPRTNGSNEPHFAYVTLLTTDAFLPGALVLHQSLCNAQSRYPLVVMCPSNKDPLPNDGSAQMKLSGRSKDVLRKRGIQLVCVDELSPKQICGDAAKEGWEARFRDTWTKLRCACSLKCHTSLSSPQIDLQSIRLDRLPGEPHTPNVRSKFRESHQCLSLSEWYFWIATWWCAAIWTIFLRCLSAKIVSPRYTPVHVIRVVSSIIRPIGMHSKLAWIRSMTERALLHVGYRQIARTAR